jgi:hypothetical protein
MSNLKKWTQKDGTKIRIKDMTDKHLVNAVKMVLRMSEVEKEDLLCHFPSFSEDSMAQYYAEQEWNSLDEMDTTEHAEKAYPIFNDLMDEIYKRNLEEKI